MAGNSKRGRQPPDNEDTDEGHGAKSKPAILSRTEPQPDTLPKTTPMLGTAQLSLPNHPALVSGSVGNTGYQNTADIQLILADGELSANSMVLASISPYLKKLLKEAWTDNTGQWVRDEFPVISLPEVSKHQMGLLLSLLYTGKTNLYHRELADLVSLTHQLKLVSIPVAIVEEQWTERQQVTTSNDHKDMRAIITFVPAKGSGRGRPAKILSSASKSSSEIKLNKIESKGNAIQSHLSDVMKDTTQPTESAVPQPIEIIQTETRRNNEKEAESPERENPNMKTFDATKPEMARQSTQESMESALQEEDQVIVEHNMEDSDSDLEEFVEEMEVFVSCEGQVERLELLGHPKQGEGRVVFISDGGGGLNSMEQQHESERGKARIIEPAQDFESETGHTTVTVLHSDVMENNDFAEGTVTVVQRDGESLGNGDGTVTVLHTEDGEGLDSLISVAEAFERSQQPDFNDIASPVVDGTDTDKHLVRNCTICNKSLLGRNALGRHMKNVHPKVFGPYRCSFPGCAKLIESGAKMVTHMYHHTGGRTKVAQESPSYQCNVDGCLGVFASSSRLTEHMKKKHEISESLQKQNFSCNAGDGNCIDVFTTARGFIKHMKESHNMKPWYCSPCDKRFMERQNLQFHMMSHGNKKNFACDICNKSFSNPRQLYTHRALHLGKRFLCQECGYRARSSANLRGHVKAKHEARQHACEQCNKKFSSGNNLRNHLRIHTGDKPYVCHTCGKAFNQETTLRTHMRIHSGLKPFKCDECGEGKRY
eukprot:TRINITY_DN35053_c0_g1_i1.p1 TRINITY_DN35053_c0_g1~~TRINITY_DN35053_c0_g1_i1.p1  ORF type:complete len:792 (-),score=164.67 TRINITY_DN35053_c0_g1_i1:386-2689(-)